MIVKTWNCTRLGNKVKKGFFRRWLHDADITSLQETFVPDAAVQFPGFIHYLRPATYGASKKKLRGGLATLVSSQLSSAFSIATVEDMEFEGLESICLRIERVVDRCDLPCGFIVLNVYVVAQLAGFDYSTFYYALEAYLSAFDLPVIVMGDFNAHLRVGQNLLPTA
jgi:exonuclease III